MPPNADDPGDGDDAPAVEIERVGPADVDPVVDLWVDLAASQRTHGSHILAEPNRNAVQRTLTRHAVAGSVYAARRDDDVVGFVSVTLEQESYKSDVTRGIVHNVYVAPGFRDSGIGDSLLDAAETALNDAGASTVTLEAMAANESAKRFYRRRGYLPHRVELEKPLGAAGDTSDSAPENDTHSKED
jgi:ribosomal protein S18 acetylase RimI-like enzyme